jgi:hypothetical protein
MKIFTDSQFEKLTQKIKYDSFQEGYRKGNKDGYNAGLHVGLTTDKKGVHINSSGIYSFNDNKTSNTIPKITTKTVYKGL